MKRYLNLLLIFISFTLIFSSCQNKKSAKKGQNLIGMANPMRESTNQQIYEKFSLSFNIPSESEDEKFFIIQDKVAQFSFSWHSLECISRFAPGAEMADISGLYYDWEKNYSEIIDGKEIYVRYVMTSGGDIISSSHFFDEVNKINYSFSISVIGIGPGDIDDVGELCKKLALQCWQIKIE